MTKLYLIAAFAALVAWPALAQVSATEAADPRTMSSRAVLLQGW